MKYPIVLASALLVALSIAPRAPLGDPYVRTWIAGPPELVSTIAHRGAVLPEEREALAAHVARNAGELGRALTAALEVQRVSFTAEPDLKTVREVASTLVARGLARPPEESNAALADCLAAMRLGAALAWSRPSGANLLDLMVGHAVEHDALRGLRALLDQHALSAAQARGVLAWLELRAKQPLPTLSQVLRVEGRQARATLETLGDAAAVHRAFPDMPADLAASLAAHGPAIAPAVEKAFEDLAAHLRAGTLPVTAAPAERTLAAAIEMFMPDVPSCLERIHRNDEDVAVLSARCRSLGQAN